MSSFAFITLISGAILAILIARTWYILRREKDDPMRGSDPGDGHHTIHAEYSSGISGHSTSYKVPRDPQAYAKLFVPKPKDTSK